MQAIKQSVLLRPISRSSSPVPGTKLPNGHPDSTDASQDTPMVRTSSKGPLNRLSLSSLRGRASGSVPAVQTIVPANTLVQDGSYLEALSLKISEAVSRALAPSTGPALPDDVFNNRRAIPAGRGTALGNVIIAELTAAKENPQLYKAILRLLQRPLSVLLTNISAQLLPALSCPSFQSCDPSHGHNAAQLYALAIAGFASELMKSFDQSGLGVNNFSESRGDGLQGIREGFEGIVTRVLTPLTLAIKQDVNTIIADLEKWHTEGALLTPPNNKVAFLKATPVNQALHPAIHQLQLRLPAFGRFLQRYVNIGGKSYDSQLAALIINFIWRALVSLSHRKPNPAPGSPSPPPISQKKRISPPTTPRIGLNFKGSMTGSRPPSPTTILPVCKSADTRAVYDLLQALPRPGQENTDACEAIDEGFDDLRVLANLFESLDAPVCNVGDADIELLTDELPALIALPILLSSLCQSDGSSNDDVWTLLDLEEQAYRRTCLASFGREEDCSETVLKKLLEIFSHRGADDCAIARWIKARLE